MIAAIGAYQWVTRDVFWNPKVIVGNAYAPFYRVNSVFWDPSIYGRFLVVAIIACLVVVLATAGAERSPRRRPPGSRCSGSGSCSRSRSRASPRSWSRVLGAATWAWGRRALVPLAAVAVLLVLVGFSAPSVRDEFRDDLDRATSGRSSLVGNGVRIARDNAVAGVGLGGFRREYAARTGLRGDEPKRAASHSTPVTVAAEGGYPGMPALRLAAPHRARRPAPPRLP